MMVKLMVMIIMSFIFLDFLASKYHVFISHSREADTMHTVDILMLRLKQEGLSVFVDQRSIQPGDKWPFEIASAIKTCNAFVVVLSKRYVRSVYCNGELFEAEALGKCMFPVVCEDSWRDVPGGAPVMEVVRDVQDVSLVAGNTENQLTRLVQGIKGQSVTNSVTPSPTNSVTPSPTITVSIHRSCGTFITRCRRSRLTHQPGW